MDLVFIIFAAITGVMIFLAVQQAKIKKQIEENRRQRGELGLPGSGGPDPTLPGVTSSLPDATSHHPPDAGGHHGGGHDGGGGFDGGGGHH